jgi:hypothetical protein
MTTTRHRKPYTPHRRPRLLPPEPPDLAAQLRSEIAELGRQMDRRTGAKPGTAERGFWFWFGPPHAEYTNVAVLTRIHRDAVQFLLNEIDRHDNELAEGP